MNARRIPLPRQPSLRSEVKLKQLQNAARVRIGQKLRQLRRESDLSLRQLGIMANVSTTYLSETERGMRAVTIDFLVRMAHHLTVKLSDLISDD